MVENFAQNLGRSWNLFEGGKIKQATFLQLVIYNNNLQCTL
jgi:hypothetical protein